MASCKAGGCGGGAATPGALWSANIHQAGYIHTPPSRRAAWRPPPPGPRDPPHAMDVPGRNGAHLVARRCRHRRPPPAHHVGQRVHLPAVARPGVPTPPCCRCLPESPPLPAHYNRHPAPQLPPTPSHRASIALVLIERIPEGPSTSTPRTPLHTGSPPPLSPSTPQRCRDCFVRAAHMRCARGCLLSDTPTPGFRPPPPRVPRCGKTPDPPPRNPQGAPLPLQRP